MSYTMSSVNKYILKHTRTGKYVLRFGKNERPVLVESISEAKAFSTLELASMSLDWTKAYRPQVAS